MPSRTSRRRFLRLAGATAAGLAGCSQTDGSAGRITVTPAPLPADRPSSSSSSAGTTDAATAAALEFDVRLRSGFSDASPARLEIVVRNVGDIVLTALGGSEHVLPFVDDNYAGVDRTGHVSLFLAPDDSALTVAPEGGEPGPLDEFLPAAPVAGCWSLPFDWPAAWGSQSATGHSVSLPPGEHRRHRYGLYYVDECIAGSFAFANTFELVAGDSPGERSPARVRLGFVLTVTGELEVLIGVQNPVIEVPPGRDS